LRKKKALREQTAGGKTTRGGAKAARGGERVSGKKVAEKRGFKGNGTPVYRSQRIDVGGEGGCYEGKGENPSDIIWMKEGRYRFRCEKKRKKSLR